MQISRIGGLRGQLAARVPGKKLEKIVYEGIANEFNAEGLRSNSWDEYQRSCVPVADPSKAALGKVVRRAAR
jgi:hypothetical protein